VHATPTPTPQLQVSLSEKVWETYVGTGVQEGRYDGEPDALVIRDIMQFANSRADAIAFTESIKRTWVSPPPPLPTPPSPSYLGQLPQPVADPMPPSPQAIFIGVGEENGFNALGYREKDLQVFGPGNITSITHMPVLSGMTYIDKHPQPSHDNTTLPALMAKYHGSMDYSAAVQYIPRLTQSGDLHAAIYDWSTMSAYIAVGKINAQGQYGEDGVSGKACNRPFVKFSMADLLTHTPTLLTGGAVASPSKVQSTAPCSCSCWPVKMCACC
jgi:hypothetical protein